MCCGSGGAGLILRGDYDFLTTIKIAARGVKSLRDYRLGEITSSAQENCDRPNCIKKYSLPINASMSKPRVIKHYDKLDEEILEQIKLAYPGGFLKNLIRFTDVNGSLTSALPFETEEKYYLIRMTKSQATDIIADDDDYGEDGKLIDKVRVKLEDKYDDDDDFEEEEGDDFDELDELEDDDLDGDDFDEEDLDEEDFEEEVDLDSLSDEDLG